MGEAKEEKTGTISVSVFGRTDVGLVREHNEDNFLVAVLDTGNRSLLPEVRDHEVGAKGSLFAVCDGMGGAAAGEVASQFAADTVFELMEAHEPGDNGYTTLALRLEEAVLKAGKKIYDEAKANRSRRGMGTTITAAALVDERMVFAQVGDSRAYVVRDGEMVQATRDQSLVNQLIEAGQLKPEEADLFEHSNIILQALGTAEEVSVDLTFVDLRQGDTVIFCSDGLSGLVNDEELCKLVVKHEEPIEACKALTEAAREGGGHDNITVIVACFDGDALEKPGKNEAVLFQRLDIEGRLSKPLQPQNLGPSSSSILDDDGEEEDKRAASEALVAEATAKRRDKGPESEMPGPSRWIMLLAVAAVLGVGMALGYMIVHGTVAEEQGGPSDDDDSSVACNFTTNVRGARLIVDGQDYNEIPEGGLFLDLPAGEHSVEARVGQDVIKRQRLRLQPGQEQIDVALDAATPEPLLTKADAGALRAADGGILDADLADAWIDAADDVVEEEPPPPTKRPRPRPRPVIPPETLEKAPPQASPTPEETPTPPAKAPAPPAEEAPTPTERGGAQATPDGE